MKHQKQQSGGSARPRAATARSAASHALLLHARRYPLLRPLDLDTTGLAPRDSALAHAIHDGALRRWITIAYLIERVLDRPWTRIEPALQASLLCGATQLLFMDRVPAYAAIHESVEWTKETLPRGAGLVNAGLRGLLRLLVGEREEAERRYEDRWTDRRDCLALSDGRGLVLTRPVLPEDAFERAIVATSTPRRVLGMFERAWGNARAQSLHNLVEPPVILNTEFLSGELPVGLRAHARPGSAVFEGTQSELRALLKAHPQLFVQDAGSSLVVRSARDLSPRLVLDLCAGLGTKTRQLALTFPRATIIATDEQEACLVALQSLADEFGNVRALAMDDAVRECAGRCDLVLADVPCTNTGVLARRLEARYRYLQDAQEHDRLMKLQEQIVMTGASLLAPGGTMLYSTCSMDPSENTHGADLLRGRLGLREVIRCTHQPTGIAGDDGSLYSDGSFHARLVKL